MKSKRQEAIKEILSKKRIGTQRELVLELKKKGFKTTQATLSRDIGELGLQKSKETGVNFYTLPTGIVLGERESHLRTMVRDFVLGVTQAENLIVIKTSPGAAPSVAASIDYVPWDEILGTVAGDDTILIVTGNNKLGEKVRKKLRKLQKA